MMAGLTVEERRQLGLAGYSIRDIRYLSQGTAALKSQENLRKIIIREKTTFIRLFR
jgi:hypothetical protein